MLDIFNVATRRNYSQHVLRAHFGGFRPMTIAQFARFELFKVSQFSL